jgi:hypothetical protein
MQSSRGSGPHPLSQPPINATASLMLSPSPPELRGGYSPIEAPIPQRRRFSFPASLASIHETKVEAPSRSVDATSTNVNGDAAPSTDAGTQTPPGGEVWRGLLSQTIDIEGVGRVSVSRFMAEVWKLGGPVIVSQQ